MKKVLIAQPSLPHYRVPFFNKLEKLRPNSWSFNVIVDPAEFSSSILFNGTTLLKKDLLFPYIEVQTKRLTFKNKQLIFQCFFPKFHEYDLIIIPAQLNNLIYLLYNFYRFTGSKIAYWGHGEDREVNEPMGIKFLIEKLKLKLAINSSGYFAYTSGVKEHLIKNGINSNKIIVVNNTIDIEEQRKAFIQWYPKRNNLREKLGIKRNARVLLFVGRFTKNKRLNFLLDAYSKIKNIDDRFQLLLVGDGLEIMPLEGVSVLGTRVDINVLAQIYIASDLFVFPGAVGLAPLQAFCYDLPAIIINSPFHKPEIDYLSKENSIILPRNTTPQDYANAIVELFNKPDYIESLRSSIWHSIQHLTIENMAINFINGVNKIINT